MPITRTHAARTRLQDDLAALTKITFPVYISVGNVNFLADIDVPAVGTISASSSHQAFSELANLLRAVADEIDPSVVTVVSEDTETATHGRPVENVDLPAVGQDKFKE